MRRSLGFLFFVLLAVLSLTAASVLTNTPAFAEPIAQAPHVWCGNSTDGAMDTGAGTMIKCTTTVTNNVTAINPVNGNATGSAVIKVVECTGPANGRLDPNDLTCHTDQHTVANLVTQVTQCNGVGYGGGNVLECRINVTTKFIGVTPKVIHNATSNQCNGGPPVTTGCNPFPATTTNATITQCNNSSYGGGQEDFNCDASGTTTASLKVVVHQCNNSNYGGGSWLNCSAELLNRVVILATPTPTVAATPSATPTLRATPRATPTVRATPTPTLAPGATPTAAPMATPTLAPGQTATPTPVGPQATPGGPTAKPTPELPNTSTFNEPNGPSSGTSVWLLAAVFFLALALITIFLPKLARRERA